MKSERLIYKASLFFTIHTFIFYTHLALRSHGGLMPISSSHQARGGECPGQVAFPLQSNTKGHFYLSNIVLDCQRKPENPCMLHEFNIQIPCRKNPGWDFQPGPLCCKATVLPATTTMQPVTCILSLPLEDESFIPVHSIHSLLYSSFSSQCASFYVTD